MSGSFDLRSGVGTQMITTSLRSSTPKSAVASYRPSRNRAVSSASVTSGLPGRPKLSAATRSRSVSRPVTLKPLVANSTANGRPTYPWPMMVSRAVRCSIFALSVVTWSKRVSPRANRSLIDCSGRARLWCRFPAGCGRHGPRAPDDDLRGVDEDPEIEPQRHVLDVVEVVAHLLRLFVEVVGVAVADLRPAGDPRPDCTAERVVGNRVARQLVQVARRQDHHSEVRHRVGPRPHEVHVGPKDVDELGQLVEPEPPEPPPEARDPIVVVPFPLGLRAADRLHRTELDQFEGSTGQPHALLDEEHGAAGVELDQEHDHSEEGRQDDGPDHRHEEAERTRKRMLETRRPEVTGKNDAAGRERLEGELPGQALVDLGDILDHDAAGQRLDEAVERQALPSLVERDDDAIGPGRFDDATEVLDVVDHPDDGVPATRQPLDRVDDLTPEGASPEDQHALADVTEAPDAATHAAQPEHEGRDDEKPRQERAPAERRLGHKIVDIAHRIHASSGRARPRPVPCA